LDVEALVVRAAVPEGGTHPPQRFRWNGPLSVMEENAGYSAHILTSGKSSATAAMARRTGSASLDASCVAAEPHPNACTGRRDPIGRRARDMLPGAIGIRRVRNGGSNKMVTVARDGSTCLLTHPGAARVGVEAQGARASITFLGET
jgi:hypothetical protein